MSAGLPMGASIRGSIERMVDAKFPDWKIQRELDCDMALKTIARVRQEYLVERAEAHRAEFHLPPPPWNIPEAILQVQLETIAACWASCLRAGPPATSRALGEVRSLLNSPRMTRAVAMELRAILVGVAADEVAIEHVGHLLDRAALKIRAPEQQRGRRVA